MKTTARTLFASAAAAVSLGMALAGCVPGENSAAGAAQDGSGTKGGTLNIGDVTVQNLQHADGRSALENGSVDARSGLDPIMAAAEKNGDTLFYRNIGFNTYGFLNATESFLKNKPDVAQKVVDAYEKAREWAKADPAETAKILAKVAGIDEALAKSVIVDRTNLAVDPVPGEAQTKVLDKVGRIFVASGDVAKQEQIDTALKSLFDDSLVKKADPSAIKAS